MFQHWDDPRLATFAALRRRGITPEAIRHLILDVGIKAVDVVLSWENLYAHNRKLIDDVSNRYFFVNKPRVLTVKNIPQKISSQIPLHPNHPERGTRYVEIVPREGNASFLISNDDANNIKRGEKRRLIGLLNFQVETVNKKVEANFHSTSHKDVKKLGIPLIHWIPSNTGIPCIVVMPDSITKGVAENECKKLQINEIIQFERFGFARVDKINQTLTVYYAHR
jgi:glutamyl-tRNA synthetase